MKAVISVLCCSTVAAACAVTAPMQMGVNGNSFALGALGTPRSAYQNRSKCEPVRVRVRTRTSFSIL